MAARLVGIEDERMIMIEDKVLEAVI